MGKVIDAHLVDDPAILNFQYFIAVIEVLDLMGAQYACLAFEKIIEHVLEDRFSNFSVDC